MATKHEADDQDLLGTLNDRYKSTKDRLWPTLIEPGDADMAFVDGDTCPPAEREIRNKGNRVWIDLDEINQYENQVINDIRANKRAIKFSPTGYGANDATARFYQDKTREIEYRSKAQIAYTTALQNAVWRAFGYLRIKTDWVQPRIGEKPGPELFHQDLWICEIADPNTILPDPDFKRSDLADMRFLFVLEQFTKDEFKRRWPKARAANFDRAMTPASSGWITDKSIQVAEYWSKAEVPVMTVALLENADGSSLVVPVKILKAEGAPKGFEFKREREISDTKVTQVLTNGVEILEEHDWIGRDIPFTGCFGKMLWRNKGQGSERTVHSMTRLARPAATMMSYTATAQAELTRQVPKFPYFFYENSLSVEALELLQRSYDEPVVGIPVKHTIDGWQGSPLGFPQRAPWEPPIAALEAQKESYRRSIQAAMGMTFLPTQAQSRNEKSGEALKQIESQSQRGAYHFVDSFNLMLERTGVLLEDLMDRVLIGEREVSTINEEGDSGSVWINSQREGGLPSIAGRHAVTISVGPSDQSEREEANRFTDSIVSTPEILGLAGPEGAKKVVAESVRLKNLGPVGDKIADIYDPQQNDENAIPPQAQQMLEQAKQMMQAQQQRIQELEQEQASDKLAQETKVMIAGQQDETKKQIAAMQDAQKREAEELRAATDVKLQMMQDTIDRMRLAVEAAKVETQRTHEREMVEIGHQHQLETGAQGHANAIEMQERKPEQENG